MSLTPSINNIVRFQFMMLGPFVCLLLFTVWLFAFSRLRCRQSLTILIAVGAGAVLASQFMDPSMAVPMWIYGVPLAMAAILLGLQWNSRGNTVRGTVVATVLASLIWGLVPLFRLEGFAGDYSPELSWRWSPSREQPRIETTDRTAISTPSSVGMSLGEPADSDWPGFRGAHFNSRAPGRFAELDWRTDPPRILWTTPIGPGWSSFASVAGRLFTQEQRGDFEVVSCRDCATGQVIWADEHATRFSDVVAGAGPRATPTYRNGRLFTFGAKAVLSALDASTGKLYWRHDLMTEVNAALPVWGFASSPTVVGEAVIVYAGGPGDNGLVAYHAVTGEPLWRRPQQGMNFGSAQPVSIDGREMVLFSTVSGLDALDPATGDLIWQYSPTRWRGPIVCQPQQIGTNSLIVPLGDGVGVTRLEVTMNAEQWEITEQWSSSHLKPSFNDFVYHDGFLYGFDQNIFACVNATNGERQWKQGRFGFGQVVLLPEANRLIVTSEQGEVVLLATDPTAYRELGRVAAITGKTWNHPCVAGGTLFVRNGSQAAAIELTPGARRAED
ncbi:MAG: PQQ-like beta-propeller repeat protein [Planctomycetota bacterium]|nr:PQQ-like beta-propeller repeat protein [Planctomycetota bacterium]